MDPKFNSAMLSPPSHDQSKQQTCTLKTFPFEIRELIFHEVLVDYFTEFPDRRRLIFQVFVDGIWEQKGKEFAGLNKPRYPARQGLSKCDLPALEVALMSDPDLLLYREMLSLRIKSSVIALHPSVAWDWIYDYPKLSPERMSEIEPPSNILSFSMAKNFDEWRKVYMEWRYKTWKENYRGQPCIWCDTSRNGKKSRCGHCEYKAWGKVEGRPNEDNSDFRGWTWRYTSLALMSSLVLDSIRDIEINTSDRVQYCPLGCSKCILPNEKERFNSNGCGFSGSDDFGSCDIMHAKTINKLTLKLSFKWKLEDFRCLVLSSHLRILEVEFSGLQAVEQENLERALNKSLQISAVCTRYEKKGQPCVKRYVLGQSEPEARHGTRYHLHMVWDAGLGNSLNWHSTEPAPRTCICCNGKTPEATLLPKDGTVLATSHRIPQRQTLRIGDEESSLFLALQDFASLYHAANSLTGTGDHGNIFQIV